MKIKIKDIKNIITQMSSDFRISHGKHELSFPDNPTTKATVKEADGYMILILSDFKKNGEENNLTVAKQCLAFSLSKKLGIDCTPSDFMDM